LKSCPVCQRSFPNDAGFCPADGTALTAASMAPVAPSADDPRLGTKLGGRYEIRRVVADGGMGRVYEGIDKETDSRVAVKVLHEDVSRDEISLERFKREYEISALLPHQHIVQVLDFQRDIVSSTWLLAMEFLDGEELRYVLKREKVLPPERIVRMLSQVAIGLDEAHNRNFIHRDLKPDNVFLCGTREGDNVKLLDFGSVKDQSGGNRKKLTVLGTTWSRHLRVRDRHGALHREQRSLDSPRHHDEGSRPSERQGGLVEVPRAARARRSPRDRAGQEREHPHADRRSVRGRGRPRVRAVG
jgi:serine/threonine-protein kinase